MDQHNVMVSCIVHNNTTGFTIKHKIIIVAALREAMLEVLQPFMNGLEAVRRDVEELKTQTTSEVMGNAALQKLLPYMNRIEGNLQNGADESMKSLARDLEEVNEKVCNLTEKSATVLEVLQNETRAGVEAVKSDLEEHMNNLGQTVNSVEDHLVDINNKVVNLNDFMNQLNTTMDSVNASMRDELEAMRHQIEEHNKTSELSDLYTSLHSIHTDQLAQICAKLDVIDSRLVSVSSAINDTDLQEAEQNIVTSVTKETQKMSNSLHEVMEELEHNISNSVRNELYDNLHEDLGELERDVLSNVTTQLNDLAENNDLHNHVCGNTGGWTRVAYLDMTDPNTYCSPGWLLNTINSKRTCDHYYSGCSSVFFPVSGGAYKRVCGRVTAYQYSYTYAFSHYHHGRVTTIDEPYVDGVSLTHGSPRQHIWTFAAGVAEGLPTNYRSCPCDTSVKISIPLFVGGDYFCESGRNSGPHRYFHSDDPLWDGKNCTNSSRCCSFNKPPYFTKRLSSPTTDDIEVRLCNFYASRRSPIELLEIYTKLDVVDVEEVEHNIVSGVRETTYNSLQEDQGRMNVHVCGGIGGWRRVVYLDMTDPNTNCPSGWRPTVHSKRTCGRVNPLSGRSCDSSFFPVSGGAYTSVCGRIKVTSIVTRMHLNPITVDEQPL